VQASILDTLPRGVLRPRTLCVSPRDLAKKIRPFTYRRKYKYSLQARWLKSIEESRQNVRSLVILLGDDMFALLGCNTKNANLIFD